MKKEIDNNIIEKKHNRNVTLDIAKGIGILLLIVGHNVEGTIKEFIYLFHMPLFLIISGINMKKKDNIFFSENKLLISYIIYSSIIILISYFLEKYSLNILMKDLIKTICLYGKETMWFLAMLWIEKIIIRFLDKYIETKNNKTLIVFVIYFICFFLSQITKKIYYSELPMIIRYIPFAFIRAGVNIPFVYIGYEYKDVIFNIINSINNSKYSICIVIGLFFSLFLFVNVFFIDYHNLDNGIFILNLISGFVGFVAVLGLSNVLNKTFLNKPLAFIGINSLFIMSSESFYLFNVCDKFLSLYINDSLSFFIVIKIFAYILIMYLLTTTISPLINKSIKMVDIYIRKE